MFPNSVLFIVSLSPALTVGSFNKIPSFGISDLLTQCCVITAAPGSSETTLDALAIASRAFEREQSVCVKLDSAGLSSSDDETPKKATELWFYPRKVKDRSCLHPPPAFLPKPSAVHGVHTGEQLVDFLNSNCATFRTVGGDLNVAGLRKQGILDNLYSVSEDHSVCEETEVPTREEFFTKYLSRSKPVIIKNALRNWTALKKWTNEFFYERFGSRTVHVKLSPDGEFEGCEKASRWEESKTRQIPKHVEEQLHFPDLVVVRPATADVPFTTFMDHITHTDDKSQSKLRRQLAKDGNVSAYLEYASIPQYMPELEEDIETMAFLPPEMQRSRSHLNMWLSDGHTLGKLHFDPFDNILCQVSGLCGILWHTNGDCL